MSVSSQPDTPGSASSLRWLSEDDVHFERSDTAGLAARVDGQWIEPVDVRPAFPVRAPRLVVEVHDDTGRDSNVLGLIRNLAQWETAQRTVVEAYLQRIDDWSRVARILWITDRNDRYRWRLEMQDGSRLTVESRHEKEEVISEVDDTHWLLHTMDGLRLVVDLDALDDSDRSKLWNRL